MIVKSLLAIGFHPEQISQFSHRSDLSIANNYVPESNWDEMYPNEHSGDYC